MKNLGASKRRAFEVVWSQTDSGCLVLKAK